MGWLVPCLGGAHSAQSELDWEELDAEASRGKRKGLDFREERWWPGTIRQVVPCPLRGLLPQRPGRSPCGAAAKQDEAGPGGTQVGMGQVASTDVCHSNWAWAWGGGNTPLRRPLSSLQAAPQHLWGSSVQPKEPPPALSMVSVVAAELPPGREGCEEPQHSRISRSQSEIPEPSHRF